MHKRWMIPAGLLITLLLLMLGVLPLVPASAQGNVSPTPHPLYAMPDPNSTRVYRSSVIALAGNQRYAVTANTFSGTASVVDIANKRIVAEIPVGTDPRSLTVDPDQGWMAVTSREDGTVTLIDLNTFEVLDTIRVGLWPWGVVTDGTVLYVALEGSDAIAEVDVDSRRVTRTIAVPDAPTGLVLWGSFLYVTHFESGAVSMVYLPTGQVAATVPGTPDSRLSQAAWLNAYDRQLYVPATRAFADNPLLTFDSTVFPVVNVFNLQNMNIVREGRVAVDVADRPVNMPFDIYFDRARRWMWVVNAGSNDVSVVDTNTGFAVANIPVGINPRGITAYADGRFAFVYNALDGTISVIEAAFMEEVDKLLATELDIPIDMLIGAELFYTGDDARLAQDRRLSCATCHFDGADDGQTWRDFPTAGHDGRGRNTPSLYNVWETIPWGWAGNYDELADFDEFYRTVHHGLGLMEGMPNPPLGEPNAGRSPDLDALVAYLNTFNGPGRNAQQIPPEAVQAGEVLWDAYECASCHTPPLYTDGQVYDLGDGPMDTPSLRWLWDSAPYYHDGSAPTLLDVFRVDEGPHALFKELTLAELDQLVLYLQSLPLE